MKTVRKIMGYTVACILFLAMMALGGEMDKGEQMDGTNILILLAVLVLAGYLTRGFCKSQESEDEEYL